MDRETKKVAETDREVQQGEEEMDGIVAEKMKDEDVEIWGEKKRRLTDEGGNRTEDEKVMGKVESKWDGAMRGRMMKDGDGVG